MLAGCFTALLAFGPKKPIFLINQFTAEVFSKIFGMFAQISVEKTDVVIRTANEAKTMKVV